MNEMCKTCIYAEWDCETDYYGDGPICFAGCLMGWEPHYDEAEETVTCEKYKEKTNG